MDGRACGVQEWCGYVVETRNDSVLNETAPAAPAAAAAAAIINTSLSSLLAVNSSTVNVTVPVKPCKFPGTVITSAYCCRPVLVSLASRSAVGRAGSGRQLNINALRVNLVNIHVDIVDCLRCCSFTEQRTGIEFIRTVLLFLSIAKQEG